jgi:hypothetical protein
MAADAPVIRAPDPLPAGWRVWRPGGGVEPEGATRSVLGTRLLPCLAEAGSGGLELGFILGHHAPDSGGLGVNRKPASSLEVLVTFDPERTGGDRRSQSAA